MTTYGAPVPTKNLSHSVVFVRTTRLLCDLIKHSMEADFWLKIGRAADAHVQLISLHDGWLYELFRSVLSTAIRAAPGELGPGPVARLAPLPWGAAFGLVLALRWPITALSTAWTQGMICGVGVRFCENEVHLAGAFALGASALGLCMGASAAGLVHCVRWAFASSTAGGDDKTKQS